MLAQGPDNAPLPSLRQLGETFDLHSSTILRLLRDLETEGHVWKSPAGRFYPEGSRRFSLKGAPICFIGREMWQWSQLYLEIFEGVSEICSANGSALSFLSASTLVHLPSPTEPPVFAKSSEQKKEIKRLLPSIPRGCAGILLDHLWGEEALRLLDSSGVRKIQLLYGPNPKRRILAPDFPAGAEMIQAYLASNQFDRTHLIDPLQGEPLIADSMTQLRDILKLPETRFHDVAALKKILHAADRQICLICPEDNTALKIAEMAEAELGEKAAQRVHIIATQGTGVVSAPHTRLRYDYRRLGRSAASNILHDTDYREMRPTLVTSQD